MHGNERGKLMCIRKIGVRAALVAVVSAVGLLAGAGSALAETKTFTYTGAEQEFEVPAGVTGVTIEAAGAQGGESSFQEFPGGDGARLVATFTATGGEKLHVLVGGEGGAGGNNCEGGGGGGSFVDTRATGTRMRHAAAGGGGGGLDEPGLEGSAT